MTTSPARSSYRPGALHSVAQRAHLREYMITWRGLPAVISFDQQQSGSAGIGTCVARQSEPVLTFRIVAGPARTAAGIIVLVTAMDPAANMPARRGATAMLLPLRSLTASVVPSVCLSGEGGGAFLDHPRAAAASHSRAPFLAVERHPLGHVLAAEHMACLSTAF